MANDKNFKVKNGLLAGRYLQSNGVETAGTDNYSVSGLSYDSVVYTHSEEGNGNSLFFKPDGTMFFITGQSGDDITPFTMSTAWDITTASAGSPFSVSSQATSPEGLWFKPDGTKVYVIDANSPFSVFQYTLSTAWDVSTASYDSKSFATSSQTTAPSGVSFNAAGTKMFVSCIGTDKIYEYDLSTAWDVSTASYNSVSLDVSSFTIAPHEVFFADSGNILLVAGYGQTNQAKVIKYEASTPYDLSTVTYSSSKLLDVNTPTDLRGFYVKSDGTKLYAMDYGDSEIYQYSFTQATQSLDLSTGNTFSFTPSGDTTVSFTNPSASGTAVGFSVEIVGDGSAITWPSSVKWDLGAAPTATASKELYTFITTDGGTTYYGKKAAGDIA